MQFVRVLEPKLGAEDMRTMCVALAKCELLRTLHWWSGAPSMLNAVDDVATLLRSLI